MSERTLVSYREFFEDYIFAMVKYLSTSGLSDLRALLKQSLISSASCNLFIVLYPPGVIHPWPLLVFACLPR